MSKKKYYLTLDTETATLPFISSMELTAKERQNLAIAKPLVYDIGWTITDRNGEIQKMENFLIQETFFVPQVFQTAYYKEKRPIYIQLLKDGKIKTACWNDVVEILLEDLRKCDFACAFNAAFDFKKAIPFTERYIKALYNDYNDWEEKQKASCQAILNGESGKNENYLEPIFTLRNEDFAICDLWQVACKKLLNNQAYKDYCLKNQFLTTSGTYFKTSAETTFSYLTRNCQFVEEHTALSDAIIESEILRKILVKGKIEPSLQAFPFRELGETTEYVKQEKKRKYIPVVVNQINMYLENSGKDNGYTRRLEKIVRELNEME
jgi:hypothetical protein